MLNKIGNFLNQIGPAFIALVLLFIFVIFICIFGPTPKYTKQFKMPSSDHTFVVCGDTIK